MTTKEAAQRIGMSEATIRRWIKRGKLGATMVDGKYDIEESVIDAYAETQDFTISPNGETKSVENDDLLSRNAELEQQVSQQKTAIKNQEALVERLRERLRDEWRHSEESDSNSRPSAQEMNIGTYTRRHEDGEVIFEEGSSGRDMYFVVYGEVEVSQRAGDKKMIVTTLENGDFFGEMAPLTGYSRTMTIAAKGSVYLWKMSADDMLKYMQISPRFAMYVCIKMSHRLGYANLLLRHLAVKTMPAGKEGDADPEGDTLRYLYRKLTERTDQLKDRSAELRKKNRQIRELQKQLNLRKPSIFLRGLERSRQQDSQLESVGI